MVCSFTYSLHTLSRVVVVFDIVKIVKIAQNPPNFYIYIPRNTWIKIDKEGSGQPSKYIYIYIPRDRYK